MRSEDFIEKCSRTESGIFRIDNESDQKLLHSAIGMSTEANEFLDMMKKHIYYGKDIDFTNLKEEIGDILYYMALALDELDSTISIEQERVINKLKTRYPEKFSLDKAENRDLEKERATLEQS